MRECAGFINATRTGTAPAFLVGDMNCQVAAPDFETVVADAKLERAMRMTSRIDHIFWVQDPRYRIDVLDTVKLTRGMGDDGRELELSDHPGYMSTVRIAPAT